jgi:hypothetical protein
MQATKRSGKGEVRICPFNNCLANGAECRNCCDAELHGRTPKLSSFLAQIACVTEDIDPKVGKGRIRMGRYCLPAAAGKVIRKGEWIRAVKIKNGRIIVEKINVWLGSCCC